MLQGPFKKWRPLIIWELFCGVQCDQIFRKFRISGSRSWAWSGRNCLLQISCKQSWWAETNYTPFVLLLAIDKMQVRSILRLNWATESRFWLIFIADICSKYTELAIKVLFRERLSLYLVFNFWFFYIIEALCPGLNASIVQLVLHIW